MKELIESTLPPFYNYEEEKTDSGYETMQDFMLSWTLRCSIEKYSGVNEKLQEYSKRILIALIFGSNDANWNYICYRYEQVINIISVKTKRQWNLIDLLVEVEVEIDGQKLLYILNIENKWYSSIREGQLEKSKKHIEKHYANSNYQVINLIIFCDYVKLKKETLIFCKEAEYKIVVIEDLFELAQMNNKCLTNNYLFDEYWFRF
jgi:hypothetical protein